MKRKEHILLWGSNLWYLGEGMFLPLFAVFAEDIGGNILDITWAWAVYLVVTGIVIYYIGKLSDTKISKEKLLVAGYALNAVGTFAYLFVDSPMKLMIVQVILGIAVAFATPTWEALYSKYEDKREAGYLWGLVGAEAKFFSALAIIIGGFIVTYTSFQSLFLIMGVIQTIATFYQAQILGKNKLKAFSIL